MAQEFVVVVDEHDKPLAIKAREDVLPTDIIRVAVLWIEDGKGNVLVQQRSLQKKIGPGLWGPAVAGTVEEHETYVSNIIKEAEEEIGLHITEPTEVGKKLFWENDHMFGRMFTFFMTQSTQQAEMFTIKKDEVAQLTWLPKTELLADAALHPEKYVPSAVFWPELFA